MADKPVKASGQFTEALKDNIKHYDSINRSYASRTFTNTDTSTSVRSEYNKGDYEYYRPGEAVPKTSEQLMAAAQSAYENVSIVRSVIDMMGDFTAQGARIVHPNKQIENFMKDWAKTVFFENSCERIANTLYRLGNCPIKKRFGKVPIAVEKEWRKTFSDMSNQEDDLVMKKPVTKYRTLPLSYTILDPLSIEVIGGEITTFIGKPLYGLKISQKFKQSILRLEREAGKVSQANDLLQFIPDDIKTAVKAGKSYIPIDPTKLKILFYKKDDWKVWSTPMLSAILDALAILEKMHLADASALDGAISQVRLWILGDIEHDIMPGPDAINKLRDILSRVGTGGVLDLIWGPGLDFKESKTDVHHYLSSDKYHQIMTEIYSGLGVPQTLTGGSGQTAGFTNNYISMKTLIERLEYGRRILIDFWNEEFKQIQKAMGWRFAPKLIFDYKVLSDENTERALLLDMWDRDILATESMQELCRRDPDLENMRIRKEMKKRENGKAPVKASPYHNPEKEFEMQKLAMQGGTIAPSEVGINLKPRKDGEETPLDKQGQMQMKMAEMKEKYKPKLSGGRPKNSNDKKKRKVKKVTPRSSAFNLFVWAEAAQDKLSDVLNPAILEKYNKKNMRSLTKSEMLEVEDMKFIILSSLVPYSTISDEIVYNILGNSPKHDGDILREFHKIKSMFEQHYDKTPTIEDCREMFSTAYARIKSKAF